MPPKPGPAKKSISTKPPAPQHRPRPPAAAQPTFGFPTSPVSKIGQRAPTTPTGSFLAGGGTLARGPQGQVVDISRPLTGTFLAGGGKFARGYFGEAVPISQGAEYTQVLKDYLSQRETAGVSLGGDGGGGDGGGGGGPAIATVKELHEIQWKPTTFDVGSGTAPSWWTQQIPTTEDDAADPRVNFMMTLNAMIPYLSPEDQRNAAAQLYSMDADHWSAYKPEAIQVNVPVTEETALAAAREGTPAGPVINREYFQSRLRSRDAINLLSQLRDQTVGGNRWKISPGYTLLQQILGASEQFGGGGSTGQFGSYADTGRQTRSQQLAQMGALDPLLAQSKSPEAGGFGMIAQLLSSPFFSQGGLNPTYQGPGGRVLFGRPNSALGF